MALLFRVSGFFGLVSTSHVNYTCILGLQRRLQISRIRAQTLTREFASRSDVQTALRGEREGRMAAEDVV